MTSLPAQVPGVIISHSPATSGRYIGSPSLVLLPNGDYVASHDFFGPDADRAVEPTTLILVSADKGKAQENLCWLEGYVDWHFDDHDIVFVSRTPFEDDLGGAHSAHDANYLALHRMKHLRRSAGKAMLPSDSPAGDAGILQCCPGNAGVERR